MSRGANTENSAARSDRELRGLESVQLSRRNLMGLALGAAAIGALPGFARTALADEAENPALDISPERRLREALSAWKKVKHCGVLAVRTEAFHGICKVRTSESLQIATSILTDHVDDPFFQEKAASLIAGNFSDEKFREEILLLFQTEFSGKEYSWLHYEVYRTWIEQGEDDFVSGLIGAVRDNPYMTATMITALSARPSAQTLPPILTLMREAAEQPLARALVTEAVASYVEAAIPYVENSMARDALKEVINSLDHPQIPERSKIFLGRLLASILECDTSELDAASWRSLLEARTRPLAEKRKEGKTRALPSFFGIELDGKNIQFVIDVSASMSSAFSPSPSQEQLLTSRYHVPSVASKGVSRFTMVKAALKSTIRSLRPDQKFSILLFNKYALPLQGFERPREATRESVAEACLALDEASCGLPTNTHGALTRAFCGHSQVGGSQSYVDERQILNGPDTILLLTDGEPTMDSHSKDRIIQARLRANYQRRGLERLAEAVRYAYCTPNELANSVTRMNLFRKVRVHAVGLELDDAQAETPKAIAHAGNGRFVVIRSG